MSEDEFTEAGGMDADPFADPAADMGGEVDPASEGSFVDMLRSTQPAVAPADVGRDLDLAEPWYNHFGAGFLKVTGSEGTEAWMHFVMGGALLVTQEFTSGEGNDDEGGEQGTIEPDETMPEPDGEGVFDGPQ